jgi:hypothetical protein
MLQIIAVASGEFGVVYPINQTGSEADGSKDGRRGK